MLVVAFYFCFTDYRLRPPGGDAKGDVPELDAHARLVVAVTAFNQCLSWAGWTSYEAMLGLVIYNEYGWEGIGRRRHTPRAAARAARAPATHSLCSSLSLPLWHPQGPQSAAHLLLSSSRPPTPCAAVCLQCARTRVSR